jgi:hypothetical protein
MNKKKVLNELDLFLGHLERGDKVVGLFGGEGKYYCQQRGDGSPLIEKRGDYPKSEHLLAARREAPQVALVVLGLMIEINFVWLGRIAEARAQSGVNRSLVPKNPQRPYLLRGRRFIRVAEAVFVHAFDTGEVGAARARGATSLVLLLELLGLRLLAVALDVLGEAAAAAAVRLMVLHTLAPHLVLAVHPQLKFVVVLVDLVLSVLRLLRRLGVLPAVAGEDDCLRCRVAPVLPLWDALVGRHRGALLRHRRATRRVLSEHALARESVLRGLVGHFFEKMKNAKIFCVVAKNKTEKCHNI